MDLCRKCYKELNPSSALGRALTCKWSLIEDPTRQGSFESLLDVSYNFKSSHGSPVFMMR